MPTYEFACADCDLKMTSIRDYEDRKRPAICPNCDKPMEYVFPAPVFYFEGGSPTAKREHQVTSQEAFFEDADSDL